MFSRNASHEYDGSDKGNFACEGGSRDGSSSAISFYDHDDGVPDYLDLDSDNDLIPDM